MCISVVIILSIGTDRIEQTVWTENRHYRTQHLIRVYAALIQQFLDTSAGSQMGLFKFYEKQDKKLPCYGQIQQTIN